MIRIHNPNLEILMLAVEQLGALADEMVFLGGCATGLLITDPAAPPIRVRRDVDAVVQAVSRADYYKISDRLRASGFSKDTSDDAPICRWVCNKIILDVMPTDSSILGFGNKWYAPVMEQAEPVQLPSGKQINMVSAPYFLITKLEAFEGRGNGDYLVSNDIEDIVAVLDGRPGIIDEIMLSEPRVCRELAERFHILTGQSRFVEAIAGHLPSDASSQARAPIVLNTIKAIAKLQ